jgi:hypothetical protein
MAGLFSSGEQDMLGNIVQQRQQANQALGQNYGKYSGIVQAGAGMADIGADAMFGGKTGASDPRMQQMNEVKNIFSQVAMEVGNTTSAAFYNKLAQAWSAKFPEQAAKAADKARELETKDAEKADQTKNVYELIETTDLYGNKIQKQVMVTYKKDKNGKWVKWGTAEALPENSRGKDFDDPRLGGAEKKPRGEVEIGAAIKDEIGATIKLPPLKDQGGNLAGGADPYSLPSPDEKPMQFPSRDPIKKLQDSRKFLFSEQRRLKAQGKSTAQVDKALQANQEDLKAALARIERK